MSSLSTLAGLIMQDVYSVLFSQSALITVSEIYYPRALSSCLMLMLHELHNFSVFRSDDSDLILT